MRLFSPTVAVVASVIVLLCGCQSSKFENENLALRGNRSALREVYLLTRATEEDDGVYYRWLYVAQKLGLPEAKKDWIGYAEYGNPALTVDPKKIFELNEAKTIEEASSAENVFAAYSLFQHYLLNQKPEAAKLYRDKLQEFGIVMSLLHPIPSAAVSRPSRPPYTYLPIDRRNLLSAKALKGDLKAANQLHKYFSGYANSDEYIEFKTAFWAFVIQRLEAPESKIPYRLAQLLQNPKNLTPGVLLRDNLEGTYERYCMNLADGDTDVAETFEEQLKVQKLAPELFFILPTQ